MCNKEGDPPDPVPLEQAKLSRRDNTPKPEVKGRAVIDGKQLSKGLNMVERMTTIREMCEIGE